MNKLLIILLILLMVSCEKITVLEVSLQQGEKQNYYKVSYRVERSMDYDLVSSRYFSTTLGVKNFLVYVADEDLSQWRNQ